MENLVCSSDPKRIKLYNDMYLDYHENEDLQHIEDIEYLTDKIIEDFHYSDNQVFNMSYVLQLKCILDIICSQN
jgi:hypothetical protein